MPCHVFTMAFRGRKVCACWWWLCDTFFVTYVFQHLVLSQLLVLTAFILSLDISLYFLMQAAGAVEL